MSNATQPIQAQRLVFTGKQQVYLDTFELAAPKEGEVRVRVNLSLMSTGTENIVFNRLFDPGTHWDNWVKYPFYPGYSAVGTVEGVGPNVKGLKVGDRVAARKNHWSHFVAPASDCIKIPDAVPFDHAVWFALAKITWHSANAAEYILGDTVLVIGAGPIGQMALRWANAAGAATIIVADAMPSRLALAQKGGATAVISGSIEEAKEQVLAANDGKLPRVVVDSTGNAKVFAMAQSLTSNYGRIVIVGDTGSPTSQHLTGETLTRRLTIVGVHDGQNTPEWNNTTISQLFFKLAATGRFPLDFLNTHRFKPAQCAEAYAAVNRDRASTMGVVFEWE